MGYEGTVVLTVHNLGSLERALFTNSMRQGKFLHGDSILAAEPLYTVL